MQKDIKFYRPKFIFIFSYIFHFYKNPKNSSNIKKKEKDFSVIDKIENFSEHSSSSSSNKNREKTIQIIQTKRQNILSQKTSLNSLFSSNLFFTRKKKTRNDPTSSNFQNSPYTKSIVDTMQLDEKRRIEGKGGARQESDEKRETLEGLFGEAASESRSPCWKFEIVTVSSARIIRSGHNAAVDV